MLIVCPFGRPFTCSHPSLIDTCQVSGQVWAYRTCNADTRHSKADGLTLNYPAGVSTDHNNNSQ